jgi:hypothetical protein
MYYTSPSVFLTHRRHSYNKIMKPRHIQSPLNTSKFIAPLIHLTTHTFLHKTNILPKNTNSQYRLPHVLYSKQSHPYISISKHTKITMRKTYLFYFLHILKMFHKHCYSYHCPKSSIVPPSSLHQTLTCPPSILHYIQLIHSLSKSEPPPKDSNTPQLNLHYLPSTIIKIQHK